MSINRQIIDGKLNLCTELIGGPLDGVLVNNDLEVIEVLRRLPIIQLSDLDASIPKINVIAVGRYVRVSAEKALFRYE